MEFLRGFSWACAGSSYLLSTTETIIVGSPLKFRCRVLRLEPATMVIVVVSGIVQEVFARITGHPSNRVCPDHLEGGV